MRKKEMSSDSFITCSITGIIPFIIGQISVNVGGLRVPCKKMTRCIHLESLSSANLLACSASLSWHTAAGPCRRDHHSQAWDET